MKFEDRIRTLLGDFDPAAPAPPVQPVNECGHRPRWSVMIPTFNCAHYLRQTLESVLSQAPNPEEMQIEVIDDCSTKDDPSAVVREIGNGRVGFYRKEKNKGAIANFNTCIERSRGELVHILHGDDFISPGFYETVGRSMGRHPTAGIAIVRSYMVNENGKVEFLPEVATKDEGPHRSFPGHLSTNHFFTPGLVVRRMAYETLGGYRLDLPHVADWEMTIRIYSNLGGVYISEPHSSYRVFDQNDTGRLAKVGENILDQVRLLAILSEKQIEIDKYSILRDCASRAIAQAQRFASLGDVDSAACNIGIAEQINKVAITRNRGWLRLIAERIKCIYKS